LQNLILVEAPRHACRGTSLRLWRRCRSRVPVDHERRATAPLPVPGWIASIFHQATHVTSLFLLRSCLWFYASPRPDPQITLLHHDCQILVEKIA